MAGETLEVDVREQEMGAITGSAVREIQKTHMAVLLVGSDEAKQKAKTACDAAWELNDWLRERKRSYTPAMPKLGSLLDSLSDAAFEFVKTAQHELD